MKSEDGLGIEYDENVICDVCRSPDSEEANEMVFCDSCNICVHQACYGITTIPSGESLREFHFEYVSIVFASRIFPSLPSHWILLNLLLYFFLVFLARISKRHRPMVVSDVFNGSKTRLRTLSKQRWRNEIGTVWPKVGACIMRAVDTRSEHWFGRSHGANHENLKHSAKPLGTDMCAVPRTCWRVHPVLGETVQDRLSCNVCISTWSGDACNHRR